MISSHLSTRHNLCSLESRCGPLLPELLLAIPSTRSLKSCTLNSSAGGQALKIASSMLACSLKVSMFKSCLDTLAIEILWVHTYVEDSILQLMSCSGLWALTVFLHLLLWCSVMFPKPQVEGSCCRCINWGWAPHSQLFSVFWSSVALCNVLLFLFELF